ncbi:hypothetical protein B4589_006955 [Halolamina sp. CBA1230]|uniref:hypothetical protein n=1 Tax=Halolamina sp. CBA1230 TaxID=1853690 RepID=UPI00117AF6C2|nr:hypothetical protein [Halolamina sp. CBA1230]QKY20129.1 hypothetical protein B4589_006955 [Halolamina sp. CBA1230]
MPQQGWRHLEMSFYGNQHTPNRPEWNHDRLVDAARQLGAELGRSPTTSEAVDDDRFPSLATIYRYAEGGWLGVLADAGLDRTQVRGYGSDESPRMKRDLRGAFMLVDTPHLTHRQYDVLGRYPTSVVKEHFGSWADACAAAGIEMGEKHGTTCDGPKGEHLDSYLEQAVAVVLVEHGVEYVAHPPIPGTNWVADFHLPECGLWVEVDGYIAGSRPNEQSFAEKLAHLDSIDADVVVVETPAEMVTALRERGVIAES